MIVKKKTRGFICTTAHPVGCADNVSKQIDYVKSKGPIDGSNKVLVIGASTGYGLASRIVQAFGAGADTLGVFYERQASGKRTGTAGWYNSVAFENEALKAGLYSRSLNGDAFSDEMKEKVIQVIRQDLGKIDMVVYSLASPKRMHPKTGVLSSSVLKPIGGAYSNKTVDFHTGDISEITIEPAVEEEIKDTVTVMGGEDWQLWMKALKEADVLAEGVKTVAYSYIGPELTHAVYRQGTIGRAKDHLEASAGIITDDLKDLSGQAFVSVNKALVTQSSSAIPVVPLYISLLYKIMKEKDIHENCIEQCYRLFDDFMYEETTPVDESGRIRIDDLEMRDDVQETVENLWDQVNSETLSDLSDIEGYRTEFYQLFGFNIDHIDYEQEVEVDLVHERIHTL
ncbi:trans-2-enoyl-CoA reductase family protein [Acidaminobacter sp. JC074]|uniref:enoyl-ACP reductase FabV n=1 Tax=Acidaminobacter sp. JC074 TaxID=2530199 RepID=UPI001F0E9460|nr:trans-2-enoyl-CoA reductase family protein [Acidaminobacter sp. JC074]